MANQQHTRRKVMAVIGSGSSLDPTLEQLCVDLGKAAIDASFRLASGGLGGVMAAVSQGAHRSEQYREGDVVGILPGYDAGSANPDVDLAVPTGMGIARNVVLVSTADVVVAVGGGSGTLSELALAWQLGKPIVGLSAGGGWAAKLAGASVDDRRRDTIAEAATAEQAVAQAVALTSS